MPKNNGVKGRIWKAESHPEKENISQNLCYLLNWVNYFYNRSINIQKFGVLYSLSFAQLTQYLIYRRPEGRGRIQDMIQVCDDYIMKVLDEAQLPI